MMNEGSYNNIIRSGSPFSPMTPSTPNAYKANVNRTKTRKWVEAKVQNYDGDDWGNDYDDEYGEPEPEPEPEPPSTSRVAALKENYSNQPRTFSQPSAADSSSASGPLSVRNLSSPPSLHIQTGVNPRARPVEPAAQGLGSTSSRFPPRKSSISKKAPDSDVGASISGSRLESRAQSPAEARGRTTNAANIIRPADIYRRVGEEKEKERRSMESGRPSTDSLYGRSDGATSSSNAARSSIEQRRRVSFESNDDSDISRNPLQTLAPVEEQKSEYGIDSLPSSRRNETELNKGLQDQRSLSTSPKLPDLARMSGFGDDLFSTRRTAEPSEGKHPSSTLEGPKLEPNPNIIMPPLDDNKDTTETPQQPAPSRPSLPGTWVTETISTSSDLPSTGITEVRGPVSLGSSPNPDASPISGKHAEPDDIEPTTAVKHLPSTRGDSEAIATTKDPRGSEDNSFSNPTGKHDDTVASKVIAAGPGHHPTHQSLPPLKTDNSTPNNAQAAQKPNEMAPPSSNYKGSPSQSPFTQQSGASPGLGFFPTAPLNPRRSIAAPEELSTPVIQERKATMSTVHTASPEKESDKLREEIIKSLSASPATTPDASTVLNSARGIPELVPGSLTRESTYLSDVYDDYLMAPAEEKSLQETGQLLKQESMMANNRSLDTKNIPTILPAENSFPSIRPLSPKRSPELQNARLSKRFSWERSTSNLANAAPTTSEPPQESSSVSKADSTTPSPSKEPDIPVASPTNLQVKVEEPNTISHQVSQVSSLAPGDSTELASPSPVSLVADNKNTSSRSSFAEEKEKVLIQSSPSTPDEQMHPALADSFATTATPPLTLSIQPTPIPTPAPQPATASQAKIMAFRDILNIVSIEQRIDRFDETRTQFYAMDSGLSNWITHMQSQIDQDPVSAFGGQPTPQPQPSQQQYLGASNPAAGQQQQQAGRTPTQQMFNTVGSGSGQVGAKSKELLHTAGAFGNKGFKSGMKLFNKGKKKLKGTGEKSYS